MPATDLDVREYGDDEVRALPKARHPDPSEPFPLNAPAQARGQGNTRRSQVGDRWCPYCQTPLRGSRQSCARCHPIRNDLVTSGRLQPSADGGQAADPTVIDQMVSQLLDAVDEMSRVVALASAHQHNGRRLGKTQVEDMFMACKEVMVVADILRRERNERP